MLDLQTHPPRAVVFDLADTDTVDRAAEEILKCYGQVDVLINNAGISYRGNILDTHLSVQRDVMETNYFGPIALTQGEQEASRYYGFLVAGARLEERLSFSAHVSVALVMLIRKRQISKKRWFTREWEIFKILMHFLHSFALLFSSHSTPARYGSTA